MTGVRTALPRPSVVPVPPRGGVRQVEVHVGHRALGPLVAVLAVAAVWFGGAPAPGGAAGPVPPPLRVPSPAPGLPAGPLP